MIIVVRWLLLILSLSDVSDCASQNTLELVQVLFRHGDRAPFQVFPNDPNKDFWVDGLGELTKLGRAKMFDLGKFIGRRYAGFLNTTYDSREVMVNSTSTYRNVLSAEYLLAGLYAPSGHVSESNNKIQWQPVTIFNKPLDIDYILNPDACCPTIKKFWNESPEVASFVNKSRDVCKRISMETGANITNFFDLSTVVDTLLCDIAHNLSLPSWAEKEWPSIEEYRNLKFLYLYEKPSRLRSGPLMGHMIDTMHTRIRNDYDDKHKAFFYSSHDTMLIAYLSLLNMYDGIAPNYGSALFVELHRTPQGQHVVQIAYKNTTENEEPVVLKIPNCPAPCSFEKFVGLTDSLIPDDVLQDCQMTPAILSNMISPKRQYQQHPKQKSNDNNFDCHLP